MVSSLYPWVEGRRRNGITLQQRRLKLKLKKSFQRVRVTKRSPAWLGEPRWLQSFEEMPNVAECFHFAISGSQLLALIVFR